MSDIEQKNLEILLRHAYREVRLPEATRASILHAVRATGRAGHGAASPWWRWRPFGEAVWRPRAALYGALATAAVLVVVPLENLSLREGGKPPLKEPQQESGGHPVSGRWEKQSSPRVPLSELGAVEAVDRWLATHPAIQQGKVVYLWQEHVRKEVRTQGESAGDRPPSPVYLAVVQGLNVPFHAKSAAESERVHPLSLEGRQETQQSGGTFQQVTLTLQVDALTGTVTVRGSSKRQ